MGWSGMVDMKKTPADKAEEIMDMACCPSISNVADYPYGLAITLTEDELPKLGLDSECEIGDLIDIRAFAEVTSVSKNKTESGEHVRVELQIIRMNVEDEAKEDTGRK